MTRRPSAPDVSRPGRRPPLAPVLAAVAGLSAGCVASAEQPVPGSTDGIPPDIRSEPLPLPRVTPENSDQLAFDQARLANSNAALIQFLARNPDAAQAGRVRSLLASRRQPDAPGIAEAVAGTDAEVVREFDAARLSGAAALRAFAERHRGHPLAAEAQGLIDG